MNKWGFIAQSGLDTYSEEYIRGCMAANMPLFLHGRPGEGKSQRVQEIDPDCETLELSLIPIEDLTGTMVYTEQKLQKKKPIWLARLEEKCAEEPEKTHILFLDELTNAAPAIQQLAYSLILERKVANRWTLPENVRMIAAGNEVEDSTAAVEMPEPLKDRFAHVTVKTGLNEWLEWATEHQVHPAIVSYITFRGEQALRSRKGADDIPTTPRTWERASKQLLATNNAKHLKPIIGEELTRDFSGFCKVAALNKEDILDNRVTNKIFAHKDIALRMAMVRRLTDVELEEFEKVRDFVKGAGREPLALFESLWISKDEKNSTIRAEKVAELRMKDEELAQKGVDIVDEY